MKKITLSSFGFLAFWLFGVRSISAQQNNFPCISANTVEINNICKFSSYSYINNSWLKFVPDTSSLLINISNSGNTSNNALDSIIIFESTCDTSNIIYASKIDSGFLYISLQTLSINTEYFIHVLCTNNIPDENDKFELCIYKDFNNCGIELFDHYILLNEVPIIPTFGVIDPTNIPQGFYTINCFQTGGDIILENENTYVHVGSLANDPIVVYNFLDHTYIALSITQPSGVGTLHFTYNLPPDAYAGGSFCIECILYNIIGQEAVCSDEACYYICPDEPIFSQDQSICLGECATLEVVDGNTYTWTDLSTGLVIGNSSSISVCPQTTTSYKVTGFHCQSVEYNHIFTVTVKQPPVINIIGNQTICEDECVTLNTSGGLSTFVWSPATGLNNPNIAIPTACPSTTTTYTLSGVGSNGCSNSASTTVIVNPLPVALIDGYKYTCCATNNVYIATPGFVSYDWEISNNVFFTGDGTNQINVFWGSLTGTSQIITLFITDANGCSNKIIFEVAPCCELPVDIANSIDYTTPDCGPVLLSDLIANNGWTSLISGSQIEINADLIVDVNLTIQDQSTVYVAPERKIIVEPGIILSIVKNSVVKAKCNDMWDGIYVSDISSTVRVSESVIQDALNAIVSENGGLYRIDKSSLLNNHIGIWAKNYNGNHAGYIRESEIRSVTGTLLPPYAGIFSRTYYGIRVENVRDIKFGDASLVDYTNDFRNLVFGIKADLSNIIVVNNIFRNIVNPNSPAGCKGCDCQEGTAICVTANKLATKTAIIGGSGLEKNTLRNCYEGIKGFNYVNLEVRNNDLRDITSHAIFNDNSPNQISKILNNRIVNFNVGIRFNGISGSNNTIVGNTLINNLNITNIVITNVGIYIDNTFKQHPQNLVIGQNDIRSVKTGIWLRNVSGPDVKITNQNLIKFNQLASNNFLPGATYYGIRIENSDDIEISDNRIEKPGQIISSQSDAKNLIGISVENSPASKVTLNEMKKMGKGILAYNICSKSMLGCNTLNKCFDGFYFTGSSANQNGADISYQIINPNTGLPLPTGNIWINSFNSDLAGFIFPPIEWYTNNSYNPTTPSLISGSLIDPLNLNQAINLGNVSPDCSVILQSASPPMKRKAEVEFIASGSNMGSSEYKFLTDQYGYKSIEKNAWLNLNTTDDIVYQNFHASCLPTNISKLKQFEDFVCTEDYSNAEIITNAFVSNNDIEATHKIVNDLVIKNYNIGLDQQDSTMLENIAYLNPSIYGEAVIDARVILEWDLPIEENPQARSEVFLADNKICNDRKLEVNIYPNPSSDRIIIETNGNSYNIFIIDMLGKIQVSKNLTGTKSQLDVSVLPVGVYMINIIEGDQSVSKRFIRIN
ncbi:MAG: T9SS type A sorting domain-containing protein [Bacteroidota bacterium]